MSEQSKKQIMIFISIAVVFILIRVFWLWYFKISLLESELQEIKTQLTEIHTLLSISRP